jgi:hypothetical protein
VGMKNGRNWIVDRRMQIFSQKFDRNVPVWRNRRQRYDKIKKDF